MSNKKVNDIKETLRKIEIGTIAGNNILEEIGHLDKTITEAISSNSSKYLDQLIKNQIPFISSEQFLKEKNINISKISIDDFLSIEEISEIETYLNRPLVKRAKWDRWDYLTVFLVSVVGVIIDTLVGNPKKGVSAICSDKNSFIGSWFENVHSLHSSNSPMDYQGYKMGGGGHRLRSIGHDLLGFAFGIRQIMNGTFTGGYYQDGKYFEIFSKVNQYGNPYESKSFIEAFFTYIGHIFCDFFSSNSIPVPGFGVLAQLPSREIRTFAAYMYNNGYNLRHMFIQGFSVLFIELMIRTYSYFRFKKVQGLEGDQFKQKRRELLLLSHSLVSGFNIGKVVITGNILSLNLPQISAVVFHFLPFVMFHYRNNDKTQKLLRNIVDLKANQMKLENEIIMDMTNSIEFNQFLQSQPIIIGN